MCGIDKNGKYGGLTHKRIAEYGMEEVEVECKGGPKNWRERERRIRPLRKKGRKLLGGRGWGNEERNKKRSRKLKSRTRKK